MEGHRMSFPNTRCVNHVRKVMGVVVRGGWLVAFRILVPISWSLRERIDKDRAWTWTGD